MNKSSKKIMAYAFLMATVGLIAISGSYARYTTTISGSDEAIVAKFDVRANNITSTIDLFDFVDEDAVLEGEGLVAPGTKGHFTTSVENASEVTVSYAISITESNANNIPLVYSFEEDGEYVSANEFAQLALSKGILDFEGTTKQNPVTQTEVTIYWQWAIDGDDVSDTQLGDFAAVADETSTERPSAEVTLNVNFTQMD